uniref:Metalloendopeptidase OMA1, mitochondrial n=1 Tax=Steinernema glaseri TaxID=37863 RepID=A0A1I7XXX1_9BILA
MRRSVVIGALSASVLLAGCQAVNTTSGGAVGVERKQYMFSMLSTDEVNQMYAQSYQQTLGEASTKGMLDKTSATAKRVQAIADRLILTDDEIAAVMGHEIAHALREHGREAMSKAYGVEMARQGAGALFGLGQDSLALADTVVQYSMTLPNSRSNENEADLIGLELAARAGYNPNAAISLWNKMTEASGGSQPEFMSTH